MRLFFILATARQPANAVSFPLIRDKPTNPPSTSPLNHGRLPLCSRLMPGGRRYTIPFVELFHRRSHSFGHILEWVDKFYLLLQCTITN